MVDVDFQLPFTIRKKQFRLTADDVVELTPKGKELAENEAFSGARAQVLMALNDRGSTSLKELSSDTRLPIDKVKNVVGDLMNRASVRKVGYEG
jgi:predicted xylose isomerase-like sugar epimerase